MTRINIKLALAAAVILSSCSTGQPTTSSGGQPHFTETVSAHRFYRGNLHTHSTVSDGDAPPETVIKWYKSHGYDFLALTEHDLLVTERRHDDATFVTLNGIEMTGLAAGKKPVHTNAICVTANLKGARGEKPVLEILTQQINESRAAGAITMVNHPNFGWALTADDLLKADGFELLEIASGHPGINENGDGTHPSEEELWDLYLTKKHRVFGAALDDAHHYSDFVKKDNANPGRAWIAAWAPALTREALCEAIRNGHFYAARNVKLAGLGVSPKIIEVAVENWNSGTDTIDFIGASGQLLLRTAASPARYEIRGGEGYVRAHVRQADDKKTGLKREAWTQAYYIRYD